MMPALKAEFRKLFTVRSTYFISALALVLVAFFAFYIEGFKLGTADLHSTTQLASDVTGAVSTVAIFGALVAILLLTHEYRYNTIMYTLTASRSRSKVLLAKILAISAYAIIFTLIVAVLSPAMGYLGIHIHGHTLVPQTIHYGNLLWRTVLYGWGYSMIGLLLAFLIRSQVGSIASLFLIPGAVEGLLSLLLKNNTVYLPFSALGQIVSSSAMGPGKGHLSPGRASLVVIGYLIVGWIVAWILFLRRDAN